MAELAIWIVSFVAVGWLSILGAYAIGMILLLPVTGLAWVVEHIFPNVRLLLQPRGNVVSRFRPATRAAISVLPRSRTAIVIFVFVISCGAYLALRPFLRPAGHQLIPVDFDPFAGTGPSQTSALGEGVTIKEHPSNQFNPPGSRTPVYVITDKDGSTYTVDALDENAAIAVFTAINHCKQERPARFRTYNPATGAWTVPIQVTGPDGSISEFPDGMAGADIEAAMAKIYPSPKRLAIRMRRFLAPSIRRLRADADGSPRIAVRCRSSLSSSCSREPSNENNLYLPAVLFFEGGGFDLSASTAIIPQDDFFESPSRILAFQASQAIINLPHGPSLRASPNALRIPTLRALSQIH